MLNYLVVMLFPHSFTWGGLLTVGLGWGHPEGQRTYMFGAMEACDSTVANTDC
jgi:hypothetical protein